MSNITRNSRLKREIYNSVGQKRGKNRRVLVINSNYQPITTTTLQRAIRKLFKGVAVVVLPPEDSVSVWQELDWGDWSELRPKPGESVLAACTRVFKVPEIIKLESFSDLPQRQVKISRRAVYRRDKFTCQYCGVSAPKNVGIEDMSIDHVVPKCQGGKTVWDNVVLACVDCNHKKGDLTPQEANMPLLHGPPAPPKYDILQGRVIRVDSWSHFLGDCYWESPLKD